jgi:hypothetical protein
MEKSSLYVLFERYTNETRGEIFSNASRESKSLTAKGCGKIK